jgi:hypothetical protein
MIDLIRAYPYEFVQLLLRNIRRFVGSLLSTRLFSYYLLPLMGLAFFESAWDKRRLKGELLLLASLVPVGVFLLFFIQDRYIATLLPTLVIWLGLGTYELGVWLKGTVKHLLAHRRSPSPRGSAVLTAIPTLILIVFLALLQPRIISQYTSIDSFRPEHKTVGLWLKDQVSGDTVVMSRYPAIAFYANARWEPTPNAEYDELLEYAWHVGADYWVLDEVETRELRPQLAFLLHEDILPAELQLVAVDESAKGKLAIFRLR